MLGIQWPFRRKSYGDNLHNSLGLVTRNYAKQPVFDPHRQVTGITYKAIDTIGLNLSVYEPIVQKSNGEAYANHPLLTLFNKPNDYVNSASDFVHLFAMLYHIYGENFIYMARGENTRRIMELHLLDPSRMELKFDGGELIGYVMHKSNGQQVPFSLEDVYHDKSPNPFNSYRGMSVLEKAALYVDTEINTTSFTLNYIKNSGSPSGIVSLPDMDREVFKQFAAQWRENYEGPENAGKTAFIRGGEAKFEAVGATLKDIDQKITRQMAKEDVLMMLDVPKELLGWTNDNGFGRNTFEGAYFVFATAKIEPLMRRLDRIFEFIGTDLVKGQTINVTHTSPVPEDKAHELATLEKGVNVWMTVNEARARQGLVPLGKEYDVIKERVPFGVTPAKQEAATVHVVKKAPETHAQAVKRISETQEEFRSELVANNERYLKKFKSALSRFAAKQGDQVIANINASSKAFEEWLFSVKEDSEKLAEILLPIMIELMEEQGKDVSNFITGELITITPEIRKTVEARILEISGVYNTDTIKALEATLTEGQAAGESLVKLKKRVEQVYTDAKGYRAERIARTETLRTSNSTAEEVYKQNGYSSVQWFVNPDACEFCLALDGQVKTIGKTFLSVGDVLTGTDGNQLRIDYSDIDVPPVHPNCTCSLIPVGD